MAATETNERTRRYQETVKVTLIGSVADLALGIAKLVVGFAAHSQALIADGIHSLSDLATDFMVIWAAKHAHREADEEHPYGHGRFETVATVVLGTALVAVAVGITYDAIQRLFEPEMLLKPGIWALVIAGLSIVIKEAIYHYTMAAARRQRSDILKANAWHSRTDAISSVVVVVGVGGTMAGLDYLDAIAAVGVALLIAKIGWDLGWSSLRELVDSAIDEDTVEKIRESILESDGVVSLHMLRTRGMGGDALVDVHIQVHPMLSVSEGHHIGESVRQKLIEEITEVSDVTVHIDTEDDQQAKESLKLPLRHKVIGALKQHIFTLPGADRLERITLHYMKGRLRVELTLPADLLKHHTSAELRAQYAEAIAADPDIEAIDLYFH